MWYESKIVCWVSGMITGAEIMFLGIVCYGAYNRLKQKEDSDK